MLALALVALVPGVIYGGRLYSDYWIGPLTFGSRVIEFAKLNSEALILFCKKRLYLRECCSTGGLLHCSLLVDLLRFFRALLGFDCQRQWWRARKNKKARTMRTQRRSLKMLQRTSQELLSLSHTTTISWHRDLRLLASIAKISYQIVWHMPLAPSVS